MYCDSELFILEYALVVAGLNGPEDTLRNQMWDFVISNNEISYAKVAI